MTADIINLRKVRKAAARKADERRAEANRAKFGEPKPAREARKAEEAREAAKHEAGRLTREPDPS